MRFSSFSLDGKTWTGISTMRCFYINRRIGFCSGTAMTTTATHGWKVHSTSTEGKTIRLMRRVAANNFIFGTIVPISVRLRRADGAEAGIRSSRTWFYTLWAGNCSCLRISFDCCLDLGEATPEEHMLSCSKANKLHGCINTNENIVSQEAPFLSRLIVDLVNRVLTLKPEFYIVFRSPKIAVWIYSN